jgi:hypothetical protein
MMDAGAVSGIPALFPVTPASTLRHPGESRDLWQARRGTMRYLLSRLCRDYQITPMLYFVIPDLIRNPLDLSSVAILDAGSGLE